MHARNREDRCTAADVRLMAACAEDAFTTLMAGSRRGSTSMRTTPTVRVIADSRHMTIARFHTPWERMRAYLINLSERNWTWTVYDKRDDADGFTRAARREGLPGGRVMPTPNRGEEALPYLMHLTESVDERGLLHDHEAFAHELEWVPAASDVALAGPGGGGKNDILQQLPPHLRYMPLSRRLMNISTAKGGWSAHLHMVCAIEHLCRLLEHAQHPRCNDATSWRVAPHGQFAARGAQMALRPPGQWRALLQLVDGTLDARCAASMTACRAAKYYAHVLERLWWLVAEPH